MKKSKYWVGLTSLGLAAALLIGGYAYYVNSPDSSTMESVDFNVEPSQRAAALRTEISATQAELLALPLNGSMEAAAVLHWQLQALSGCYLETRFEDLKEKLAESGLDDNQISAEILAILNPEFEALRSLSDVQMTPEQVVWFDQTQRLADHVVEENSALVMGDFVCAPLKLKALTGVAPSIASLVPSNAQAQANYVADQYWQILDSYVADDSSTMLQLKATLPAAEQCLFRRLPGTVISRALTLDILKTQTLRRYQEQHPDSGVTPSDSIILEAEEWLEPLQEQGSSPEYLELLDKTSTFPHCV